MSTYPLSSPIQPNAHSSWQPANLTPDPPRTVERKRRVPSFLPVSQSHQISQGGVGQPIINDHNIFSFPHNDIDPSGYALPTPPRVGPAQRKGQDFFVIGPTPPRGARGGAFVGGAFMMDTGLPTPAQTIKREKNTTRLAHGQDHGHTRSQLSISSPPPPPTPDLIFSSSKAYRNKSITETPDDHDDDHRILTPPSASTLRQNASSTSRWQQPMTTHGDLDPNQPLAGTFGRKRRAGLTFAQQMGLLTTSNPTSSSSCSQPTTTSFSSFPSSFASDEFSISTESQHDNHPSSLLPHLTLNNNNNLGPGIGMRGHHRSTKSRSNRSKKTALDSITLSSPPVGLRDAFQDQDPDQDQGKCKMDGKQGGGKDEERTLWGAAKILVDDGMNPFLDQGMKKIGGDGGGVIRLDGRLVSPIIELDHNPSLSSGVFGKDALGMEDHDIDMEGQVQDQDEDEGDGDYEIEHTDQTPSKHFGGYPSTLRGTRLAHNPATRSALTSSNEIFTPVAANGSGSYPTVNSSLEMQMEMERPRSGSFGMNTSDSSPFLVSNNSNNTSALEYITPPNSSTPPPEVLFNPNFALPAENVFNSDNGRIWTKPIMGDDDDLENPFLVGPGRKGKVMSDEERESRRTGSKEKETISYVFRGTKTTFANPYYQSSIQGTPSTSKLNPTHLDFSPAPVPKPRLLWKDAHIKANRAHSSFKSSLNRMDVDEDEARGDEDEEEEDEEENGYTLGGRPTRRLLFGGSKEGASSLSSSGTGGIQQQDNGRKHPRDDDDNIETGHGYDRDDDMMSTPKERKRVKTGTGRL